MKNKLHGPPLLTQSLKLASIFFNVSRRLISVAISANSPLHWVQSTFDFPFIKITARSYSNIFTIENITRNLYYNTGDTRRIEAKTN